MRSGPDHCISSEGLSASGAEQGMRRQGNLRRLNSAGPGRNSHHCAIWVPLTNGHPNGSPKSANGHAPHCFCRIFMRRGNDGVGAYRGDIAGCTLPSRSRCAK